MARLILLSCKNNDAAEAIVKAILESDDWHKEGWGDRVAELGTLVAAYSEPAWMIARPLNYCKCGSSGGGKNHKKGWGKTKRFGWWVHEGCNRVSVMVMKNFVTNLLNGSHDLLPELKEKINEEQIATNPSSNDSTSDDSNRPSDPESESRSVEVGMPSSNEAGSQDDDRIRLASQPNPFFVPGT